MPRKKRIPTAKSQDRFYGDLPGFVSRLQTKEDTRVACWSCEDGPGMLGVNVAKDFDTLGLCHCECEPTITLCLGCAFNYMTSFNAMLDRTRRQKKARPA